MADVLPESYWQASGDRVQVHPPTRDDLAPYAKAVEASRERLRAWNPVDPNDLAHHLRTQSDRHRTFLIRALEPTGDHDVVGKVNVSGITRGRALAGTLGYDSYDPYAGTGMFAEGLRLIIGIAFTPTPHGLGLHRLEACVQPGNVTSAGVLRRLGFTRRGVWPRYLWLADDDGVEAWRDHVVYGVIREEWPVPPYASPTRRALVTRPLVVVLAGGTGAPGSGPEGWQAAVSQARRLASELGVPLIRDQVSAGAAAGRATSAEGLTDRLGDAVTGAVVLTMRSAAGIASALADADEAHVDVAGLRLWPIGAIADDAGVTRVALDAVASGATCIP